MSKQELGTVLEETLVRQFRGRVSRVVTRHIIDSTGDPAVWIWIVLEDESLLEDASRAELERIREQAQQTARSYGDEWPYVTFRTSAEQREVEAEEAEHK